MWLFAMGKDSTKDFKKLTGKTKGLGKGSISSILDSGNYTV